MAGARLETARRLRVWQEQKKSDRRISIKAARNTTLAFLFDKLGLGWEFDIVELSRRFGDTAVHLKGDIIEHMLTLLLAESQQDLQFRELLACCLVHFALWIAIDPKLQQEI